MLSDYHPNSFAAIRTKDYPAVHPVPARFFIEVTRNRTGATWAHPSLQPIHPPSPRDHQLTPLNTVILSHAPRAPIHDHDSDDEADDSDDATELISVEQFEQELYKYQRVLLEMSDILDYNGAMTDMHILPTLRCRFAALADLHTRILEKEKLTHSVTGPAPKTWDTRFSDIMYIRTRPPERASQFRRKK